MNQEPLQALPRDWEAEYETLALLDWLTDLSPALVVILAAAAEGVAS